MPLFYWWPKLPSVKGWHHECEYSYAYSANTQAPDGYTFANAETVIYAKALYKPRSLKITSLAMLIKSDKEEFVSKVPNIIISEVDPIKTGDGGQYFIDMNKTGFPIVQTCRSNVLSINSRGGQS